jgi:fructose-1,6-bisphosphatase II
MPGILPANLGLDLVRATEAAALSAGRWMGLGQPDLADQAATIAMNHALQELEIAGRIMIGEEGKSGQHSPLDSGQQVGSGAGPALDLVLDPIDGTSLLAIGHSDAISVIGAAPHGAMRSLFPAVYLDKIVVDHSVASSLVPECLDAPAAWTLALVARAKGKAVRDLIVFVLDRPRHVHLVEEIRATGARVLLRQEGDVAGALAAAAAQAEIDILMGIGGAPEGVIAACAVKAVRGGMLARLAPQSEAEQAAIRAAGLKLDEIYTCDDLVHGDAVFFAATGITSGVLLNGVRYHGDEAETESLLLRGETHTRRIVRAFHNLSLDFLTRGTTA